MENASELAAYAAVARQLALLATAYPRLPECSVVWARLPAGRPDGLSRDARYMLFVYRALRAAQDRLTGALPGPHLAMRLAAIQAEAAFAWQQEYVTLAELWAAPIADFTAPDRALAVA